MIDKKKSDEALAYIRETYFPEWDKEREWTIWLFEGPIRSEKGVRAGYTDKETKKIYLLSWMKEEDLCFTLIEEICHIMTDGGHDDLEWKIQMIRVADEAEAKGDEKLSKKIHERLKSCQS